MNYPVGEIEYGSRAWLRREIGAYLFDKPDESEWSHAEAGIVDSVIESGLEDFYNARGVEIEGEGESERAVPHEWSFLHPVSSLQLTTGTRTYDLPEDCAGIVEEFTVLQ